MLKIVLTPEAIEDILEIYNYILERDGEERAGGICAGCFGRQTGNSGTVTGTVDAIKYWGLENCYNITSLCDDVKIAHQTMINYLYRLMNTDREQIFS